MSISARSARNAISARYSISAPGTNGIPCIPGAVLLARDTGETGEPGLALLEGETEVIEITDYDLDSICVE